MRLKNLCLVELVADGKIRHTDLTPDAVRLIVDGLMMIAGNEEAVATSIESHLERGRRDSGLAPLVHPTTNEFSRAARAKVHRCQALMEQLRMPNPINHQPDMRQVLVDQMMEEQRAEELAAGWGAGW